MDALTKPTPGEGVELEGTNKSGVLTLRSKTVRTLEEALVVGNVDTKLWEVERWVLNKWDCVAKRNSAHGGPELMATELWQVKVWLRRKAPSVRAAQDILGEMRLRSAAVPKKQREHVPINERRALEIDIFDLHMGLECFAPSADKPWNIDLAEESYWWALEGLIKLAEKYQPFDELLYVIGNDGTHCDNLGHTTTGGTPQPESISWHYVYKRMANLLCDAIDRLTEVAPIVKVVQIPGNHDRQTSFTLGCLVDAYFHNHANVIVNSDAAPYKFWKYGTNLIGFEHGHSIPQVRMTALMANECPDAWAKTTWREWHVGDQHRKAKFEEQGCSIEYLPALTPPNEWHRTKSFNWQKRGAAAFVYGYKTGPTAKLTMNINAYTGLPTGKRKRIKKLGKFV